MVSIQLYVWRTKRYKGSPPLLPSLELASTTTKNFVISIVIMNIAIWLYNFENMSRTSPISLPWYYYITPKGKLVFCCQSSKDIFYLFSTSIKHDVISSVFCWNKIHRYCPFRADISKIKMRGFYMYPLHLHHSTDSSLVSCLVEPNWKWKIGIEFSCR